MASYRGHLTTSATLGLIYGGASWYQLNVDWPTAAVGGVLTALGGLLPDLDSDSGVPVREMAHLTAAVAPLALMRRFVSCGLSAEQTFLVAAGIYFVIRYVFFAIFRKITVHRGMFHSIPAMLVAGLAVFLAFDHPSTEVRGFLAVGVMIGFLSHLVLDELCSVDLHGVVPKLNQFAGTAVKFYSPSTAATVFTYVLLAGLGYLAYGDLQHPTAGGAQDVIAQAPKDQPSNGRTPLRFRERPSNPDQLHWRTPGKSSTRPEGGVPLNVR